MTEDTSHLEDRQTPEMVSNQIKAEAKENENPDKPEPEQKPEEKPAETVPPKEDDKPEDAPKPEDKPEDKPEEKPEDKKPDEPLQTKPRTIYDDLKDKKKEVREAKSELELAHNTIAEKDKIIADLTEKARTAETPAEKAEVEDEIAQIAEKIGADPEGIKVLTDFLTKKLVKPDGEQISKEDLDAIKNLRQSEAQRQEKEQFTAEWGKFEPALKKDFPHVKSDELEVVKAVVDKLAHSPKYADKEIDYIYFKEKATLEKLISPQRPSYEGVDHKPAPEGEADVELSSKSTPMDAQKATEHRPSTGLEIRSAS